MKRHHDLLLKERAKFSQNSQRFANFRHDAVRKLIQIKSDIKHLISTKEQHKNMYLRVLQDQQTEYTEFEMLLDSLERQKYLSLTLDNKRRLSKMTRGTSKTRDGANIDQSPSMTGPGTSRPSQDKQGTLSRVNSLSLCRPFSNLQSVSKQSSMVLRNWSNWGDSFPDLGRRANVISASSSLMRRKMFQRSDNRRISAQNSRDRNNCGLGQNRKVSHVVGLETS